MKREEDLLKCEGNLMDTTMTQKKLYLTPLANQAEKLNEIAHGEYDPPFTKVKLKTVVESFNPKKVPGADGLTADIYSQVILKGPELFQAIVNKCLEFRQFPTIWKEATVVVLRKPGKEDYMIPKSYRPIGLLPAMGKILEKLVIKRVQWHLQPKISTRQYGFMT